MLTLRTMLFNPTFFHSRYALFPNLLKPLELSCASKAKMVLLLITELFLCLLLRPLVIRKEESWTSPTSLHSTASAASKPPQKLTLDPIPASAPAFGVAATVGTVVEAVVVLEVEAAAVPDALAHVTDWGRSVTPCVLQKLRA